MEKYSILLIHLYWSSVNYYYGVIMAITPSTSKVTRSIENNYYYVYNNSIIMLVNREVIGKGDCKCTQRSHVG